jgi:hypothetical protein
MRPFVPPDLSCDRQAGYADVRDLPLFKSENVRDLPFKSADVRDLPFLNLQEFVTFPI